MSLDAVPFWILSGKRRSVVDDMPGVDDEIIDIPPPAAVDPRKKRGRSIHISGGDKAHDTTSTGKDGRVVFFRRRESDGSSKDCGSVGITRTNSSDGVTMSHSTAVSSIGVGGASPVHSDRKKKLRFSTVDSSDPSLSATDKRDGLSRFMTSPSIRRSLTTRQRSTSVGPGRPSVHEHVSSVSRDNTVSTIGVPHDDDGAPVQFPSDDTKKTTKPMKREKTSPILMYDGHRYRGIPHGIPAPNASLAAALLSTSRSDVPSHPSSIPSPRRSDVRILFLCLK
jgi:hypothetical protein